MKYVSIRNPDAGPFGETLLEASVRAIVAASFVNRPSGGCVASVLTFDTQRRFFFGDAIYRLRLRQGLRNLTSDI